MATLQKMVQTAKRVIPRGWSPIMRNLSKVYPPARMYPAALANGDTLFVDLSESMCHLYFYYGSLPHEEYSHAFFRNFLQAGDVFVDVGANIGYFTRLASSLVGSAGRVHAFEPLPSALRLLHENTRNLKNVRLHEIAASDGRGTSSFSVQSSGDTSSLGADPASREVIRVQTDTLDAVLADIPRVDLIKIDVEGYELEVLRGATRLIRSQKPLIYFEYIERYAAARGQSLESFRQVLAPLGYSMGWISHDYPGAPLISQTPSSYLIAAPADNRWGVNF